MSKFWFWLIFWVLLAIIITALILFIVGYAAPHKNKSDNSVKYDILKWIGVGLLILGGVGMLILLYFKFRSNSKPIMSEGYNSRRYSSFSDTMNSGNTSRSSSMNSDLDYFIKTGQMRQQPLTSEQQESLAGLDSFLRQREMSY
jgi:hypothetical protein